MLVFSLNEHLKFLGEIVEFFFDITKCTVNYGIVDKENKVVLYNLPHASYFHL